MSKYIALLFLVSLNVHAGPPPEFLGTYAFSANDLKVTKIQHLITVSVRKDEAKNYVKDLEAKGYQCQQAANQISKCKKFDRGIIEDAELRADIVRDFGKNVLNFELSNDGYEVVNDTPALTELEKSQNSSFGSLMFNKIRVYIFTEGLIKLKILSTSHGEQIYFYLNDNSEISQQILALKLNQKQNLNVVEDSVAYLYEAVWKK
jgi:hypothetical protein